MAYTGGAKGPRSSSQLGGMLEASMENMNPHLKNTKKARLWWRTP